MSCCRLEAPAGLPDPEPAAAADARSQPLRCRRRASARGAYVLADLGGAPPKVILIGTGSEVSLCVAAAEQLAAEGIACARRQHALLGAVRAAGRGLSRAGAAGAIAARVAVEQAATLGWARYVGRQGAVVGMHTFGASAPLKGLLTKFGFTPDHVVTVAREQLARLSSRKGV